MNSMLDEIFKGGNPQQDDSTNYYKILGCDESANEQQILTEFKKRALSFHPDKNPSEDSMKQFQLLQEARSVLLDEKLRAKYDSWRNSGLSVSFHHFAKIKSSLHWAVRSTKELSVTDGSVASLSKKEDMDYARRQTLTGAECSLQIWRAQEGTTDELLKKFRNYEI